jgi:hypothetical protein
MDTSYRKIVTTKRHPLVGLTITGARSDDDGYVMFDLSDGSILYASQDDEGNGPGVLMTQGQNCGRSTRTYHFTGATSDKVLLVIVDVEAERIHFEQIKRELEEERAAMSVDNASAQAQARHDERVNNITRAIGTLDACLGNLTEEQRDQLTATFDKMEGYSKTVRLLVNGLTVEGYVKTT